MNRSREITEQLARAGLALTKEQAERFSEYFDLLTAWNERVNLTAITDFEEVIEKHFLDSLAPLFACESSEKAGSARTKIDIMQEKRLIDVGTGAGFPGIPLAIMLPGLCVTLLDSLNKRSDFQREVVRVLGLENVQVINGRAEDVSRETSHRENYDLAVARAVSDAAVLAEYCLPFVRTGGSFIAYKAGDVDAELKAAENAIKTLGGELSGVLPYTLQPSGSRRTLAIISKTGPTPEKYPRRAGMPAKRPIK